METDGFVELVRQAQTGDRSAMERLLRLAGPHLKQVALGQADADLASESVSDLVQEAATRIWQQLDQFRGSGDDAETAAMFCEWSGQIVRRLARDRWRDRHTQRRSPEQPILPLDAGNESNVPSGQAHTDPPAAGPSPSSLVRADEREKLVWTALAKIPDETDRTIIRMRFFDAKSLRQIADELKLSYDKVRERYNRSLRHLEHELQGLR